MNKDDAKQQIKGFVEFYNENKNKLQKQSETDTRIKFIDRMFEALGWDVGGKRIADEVQREESVKDKESKKKKADYIFRINGVTRLIVEAKSLGEDLDNQIYINQTIEYAYNKACSWSVLTNFREIRIYYVDRKGNFPFFKIDLEDAGDFDAQFETLWFLSKESFERNDLEKEAKRRGIRKEKIPVDQQLFNDLKRWREILSNDIKKKYQMEYEPYVIDEIVQRIIDRLIFIRKTEDAELEDRILDQLTRRFNKSTYEELKKIFADYNEKYNSKLFGERKTDKHESDKIEISNNVIEEVIRGMYKPRGSDVEYNFAAIDADVLGNIYEQYLAYVLTKTPKKTKLEGGRVHRKEQGIYYTPTYIVDYIVRNTLGELLKNKKIDVDKIKILDPACGSGSFLIKAFDVLDEYYRRNGDYAQTTLDAKNATTFKTKERILKNNIFGVDLDTKAVEIAQLNLLLKIAERGHRLPLLQENIKCGNSLIDDEKIAGDRAFKWEEQFKEIMQEGGFDVVIGNPPYGAELNQKERDHISKKFKISRSYKNTALIFIEKSLNLLAKNGYFGMIVPKSLAFSQLWRVGRQLIKNDLIKIVDVSKAFEDVLLEQVIIILRKDNKQSSYQIVDLNTNKTISVDKKYIDLTDSIVLHGDKEDFTIFEKMNNNVIYLSEITKTSRGLPFQKHLKKEKTKYPIIKGKNISRFNFIYSSEYLDEKLVEQNKKKIEFLTQPKIISQRIVAHVTKPKDHIIIMSALDKDGFLTVDTVENTIITNKKYSLEFLLCLLNSKLISWYAYRYIFSKAIRTMDLDEYYLGKIPLPKISIDNVKFKNLADKMITLKQKILQLGDKKTDERARIEEEIKKTDAEIDEFVYKIYGVTENEKKIIEDSLK